MNRNQCKFLARILTTGAAILVGLFILFRFPMELFTIALVAFFFCAGFFLLFVLVGIIVTSINKLRFAYQLVGTFPEDMTKESKRSLDWKLYQLLDDEEWGSSIGEDDFSDFPEATQKCIKNRPKYLTLYDWSGVFDKK